ncbi:MAG: nucleotide-binding protein [Planctomycetes bacterium]|nr:nucleotide-binding protein [Planctomycetota bacterium]MBI3836059.1 nucleotide-binding protein [Planctomycetota bacterium]
MTRAKSKAPQSDAQSTKRVYVKQADVPAASLDDALRVPQAILDHYAGQPTVPFQVAKALNVNPKGSQLLVLTGAAIAFGLIEGGAQAASISVTNLAHRILRPKEEGDDLAAKREAVLKPRVFSDFLKRYAENPFPRKDIALNVLEEMGVPRKKTGEVLERIDASARSVGFIEEIKGKNYVSLQGTAVAQKELDGRAGIDADSKSSEVLPPLRIQVPPPVIQPKGAELTAAIADDERRRRVFITHGKNRDLVDPIKKLLEYGELEPVISVEKQSVSKPVPEKVLDDMRGCGAAIIHVDAERSILGKDGTEHVLLNPNVLIEIGAAMAFYGKRFILLVSEGVKLPSNLQGLFEVRYTGSTLDAEATIKLLEAIKDIKNYALPVQPGAPPLGMGD